MTTAPDEDDLAVEPITDVTCPPEVRAGVGEATERGSTDRVGRGATKVETRSFEDLYAQRYEPMVRLAFVMLGRNDVAEDVVQDAFARVYEKWASIDTPPAYLRTAVINGCRNEVRRRIVRRRPPEHMPEGITDRIDADLLDALRVLNPRQRAVIVLRYYEGMSEAEMAAALHMSPGTVKSSLHRGLARLQEVIEP